MVSREGQGGLALGVCMKLFLMRQAVPEYVMELRSSMPSAAIAASTTDPSLLAGAAVVAGSAAGLVAAVSVFSREQPVINSMAEKTVSIPLVKPVLSMVASWLKQMMVIS